MDIRHEMREALIGYAMAAVGETREEIEKDMTGEDEHDLNDLVDIVSEVAERYARQLVNQTATDLI
jgi:hypothetical protein